MATVTPPREEPPLAEALRELLGVFSKAQRDYKTYPRNNPILARRREELLSKFSPLLIAEPELLLEVSTESLFYRGAEVYRQTDPRESLAFHLYRHGIRELCFLEGLHQEELEAFIEVINADFGGGGELDDDLITLLWERELTHIRHTAIDDLPESAAWVRDPVATIRAFVERTPEVPAPECYRSVLRATAGRPPPPLPDPAALALTAADLEVLRGLVEEDRSRDLALDVVDVLFQVLRNPLTPQAAVEMARVLQRIVEASVEERAFARAARVLARLGELAATSVESRRALQPVREQFCERRFIRRVVQVCNDGAPNPRDLYDLLVQLGAPAGAPIAEALCDVQDRRLRRVFCDATAELVKYEVNALAPVTRHPRWFVPRNVAYILGQTKNPESMKILRSLAEHPSEKVRFEALRAVVQFGSATSRELVVKALGDTEKSVRLLALELAPAVADALVLQALVLRFHDRAYRDLELGEKRALAAALARTAGDEVLHLFREVLHKRTLFGGKKIDDAKLAAVHGLVAIASPRAEETLAQAVAAEPLLAPIVEDARREVERAKETPA